MRKHPHEQIVDDLPHEGAPVYLALAGLSLLTVIGAGTVLSWIIDALR